MRFESVEPRLMLTTSVSLIEQTIELSPPLHAEATAWVDLNEDGQRDLVALDSFEGELRLSVFTAENGKLPKTHEQLLGFEFTSVPEIAMADFDGDFHPDLLITAWNYMVVLSGSSNTHFVASPNSIEIPEGKTIRGADVVDLNGDELHDIVVRTWFDPTPDVFEFPNVGDLFLSAHINEGDGSFQLESELEFNLVASSDHQKGDVNGDGHDDIVLRIDKPGSGSTFIIPNDGSGALGVGDEIPTGFLQEVNNDGVVDIVQRVSNGYVLWINDGDGDFREGQEMQVPIFGSITHLEAGHLNDDGIIDFVVIDDGTLDFFAVSPFMAFIVSNLDGTWSSIAIDEIDFYPPWHDPEIIIEDLDSDGLGDVTYVDGRVVRQFIQRESSYTVTDYDSPESSLRVSTFFDLNSDSHLDHVGAGFDGDPFEYFVAVRLADGRGGFREAATALLPGIGGLNELRFLDEEGDGLFEMFTMPFDNDRNIARIELNAAGSIVDVATVAKTNAIRAYVPDPVEGLVRRFGAAEFEDLYFESVSGLNDNVFEFHEFVVDIDGDGMDELLVGDGDGFKVLRQNPAKSSPLAGDINLDGEVDFQDFLVLANNFGRNDDVLRADGDLDADGRVTFIDFVVLAENFGRKR